MARTIKQIHDAMIADFTTRPELAAINSPGAASVWRQFLFIVAVAIWALENIFDEHTAENDVKLATMKPHTMQWYVEKAKAFQYGFPLVPNEDYYDNTGFTEEEVADSKVIYYAAAIRVFDVDNNFKGIRLKLATLDGGVLAAVPDDKMNAFRPYMARVGDAGVNVWSSTGDADSLKLVMDIYYDPLVLKADGKRIDGTNDTPVQSAIDTFLEEGIIFNGLFVTAFFTDDLQKVEGVVIPHIVSIQATYGALAYTDIPVEYQPDSGYLRILDAVTDLTLNFIAHEAV